MVILGFLDGHIERADNKVLGTLYADTRGSNVIEIISPEAIELLKADGVVLDIGYNDPRKEAR